MITGFAVELDGEILIRTVSDTEQAAQVNGLCTVFGMMPDQSWPADFIEMAWLHHVSRVSTCHAALIVPVRVERERSQ